ncbi:MAG: histidine phosphatase family protein [Candidatus Omnitrophota bacterium]|jgi:broad specificity phosphatase PhoE
MTTKLILIRHGQTHDNLEERYSGFTDTCLDEYGILQAKLLKKRISSLGIEKAFSSSLKRAFDFARISFGSSDVKMVPELREMNFGIFEGMNYPEIMNKYPDIYNRWVKKSFRTKASKGESLGDLRKRVLSAFNNIINSKKSIVNMVVTHAGPIRIILSEVLKIKNIWDLVPKSGGVSIIEFCKGKGKVLLLNDDSYLSNE